jgi:chorismate mutase/prephenate dehydratase
MKLGYLGPNTNSENAAREYAARVAGLEIQSYPRMEEVFGALESKKVERILVPVKNSKTGDIKYKKIAERSEFRKIDEVSVYVLHYLAAKNRDVRFIASHPEVLKQCSKYLDKKYPGLSRIGVESTNEAAKIASVVHGVAAIAGLETCLRYNLKIIDKKLVKNNYSTFWVLERRD